MAEGFESSRCRLHKLEATERRLGAVRTLQRKGRVKVATRQFRAAQMAVRVLQRWVRSVLRRRRLYEVVLRALQANRYRKKKEAEERKEAARKAMEAQGRPRRPSGRPRRPRSREQTLRRRRFPRGHQTARDAMFRLRRGRRRSA